MNDLGCRAVYVVDDDEVVLSSTEALLSQHAYQAKCFSSGKKFLAATDLHTCGCLIADVQMPEMDGVELLSRLTGSQSTLGVIVISGVADVPTAVSVMNHGAATLLEKPYIHTELLRSVDRALAQSCERFRKFSAEKSVQERLASLTDDERAVMRLMLRGEPNKVIASELALSLRTVDRRRQTVLTKMQIASVPELATLLAMNHMATPGEGDTSIV